MRHDWKDITKKEFEENFQEFFNAKFPNYTCSACKQHVDVTVDSENSSARLPKIVFYDREFKMKSYRACISYRAEKAIAA